MTRATVYDRALKALSAGRIIARHMGLNEKIAFAEQTVDMEFLR
jgi:hypothetical protein